MEIEQEFRSAQSPSLSLWTPQVKNSKNIDSGIGAISDSGKNRGASSFFQGQLPAGPINITSPAAPDIDNHTLGFEVVAETMHPVTGSIAE